MVGGTSFHCGILQASVGRMSTNNSKNNCNPKTFHERKSQNLSLVHVSLDNTDSVIEGGPLKPSFCLSGAVRQQGAAFLLLVPAPAPSTRIQSPRALHSRLHTGENCSTPSFLDVHINRSSQGCDESSEASPRTADGSECRNPRSAFA